MRAKSSRRSTSTERRRRTTRAGRGRQATGRQPTSVGRTASQKRRSKALSGVTYSAVAALIGKHGLLEHHEHGGCWRVQRYSDEYLVGRVDAARVYAGVQALVDSAWSRAHAFAFSISTATVPKERAPGISDVEPLFATGRVSHGALESDTI